MPPESLIESAQRALRDAVAVHAPAVFTTSLGLEDMVVLDFVRRLRLDVEVVTLDIVIDETSKRTVAAGIVA